LLGRRLRGHVIGLPTFCHRRGSFAQVPRGTAWFSGGGVALRDSLARWCVSVAAARLGGGGHALVVRALIVSLGRSKASMFHRSGGFVRRFRATCPCFPSICRLPKGFSSLLAEGTRLSVQRPARPDGALIGGSSASVTGACSGRGAVRHQGQ